MPAPSPVWMRLGWALTLLSCGTLFFMGLGSYGLLDNNEGLYATIAREMYERGRYVIPTLNGVPYIEKPPLLYWLMGGSFHLFGPSAFAARLVPALAGLGTIALCATFVARLRGQKCALISTCILGSSLGFVIFSRNVFFDGLFTFFLTGAILCLYLGWHTKKRVFFLWLYAFLAGALMTKGFLALVLVGFVWGVFWVLHAKKSSSFFEPLDPWGLVLFLALTAPWHVMASLELQGFAHFYFINEHILRFLGKRVPKDYYSGPPTYYTWRVLLYMIPWTFFLPRFLMERGKARDPLAFFMGVCFWTIFVFFSMSQAKANYYLVSAMPCLAILLALKLCTQDTFRLSSLLGCLFSVLLPLVLLADHLSGRVLLSDFSQYLAHFSSLTYVIWAACGAGLFALLYIGRKAAPTGPVFVTLSMAILMTVCVQITPKVETSISGKSAGLYLAAQNESVFFYQDYEHISAVAFYVARPVTLIDSQSMDLLFGQTQDPKRFISVQEAESERGLVVVWQKKASLFKAAFPRARLVKDFGVHQIYRLGL